MRKKTIGEVLRLARINQGLSLEELQEKTEIQSTKFTYARKERS